jgi:hypothetical protein
MVGKSAAIWIDHERALLVTVASYGTIIQRVRSDVEKRSHMGGGSRRRDRAGGGPQDVFDETSRDARHERQLQRYYHKVMELLREADCIYICGPGEAKIELRRALEKTPWGKTRIRAVEPADRMTDRQFKAKALAVFATPSAVNSTKH